VKERRGDEKPTANITRAKILIRRETKPRGKKEEKRKGDRMSDGSILTM
jgi:hypothetical protein